MKNLITFLFILFASVSIGQINIIQNGDTIQINNGSATIINGGDTIKIENAYKEYVATLYQIGNADPVATELVNSIGEIVYDRQIEDYYTINCNNCFPLGRTVIFLQNGHNAIGNYEAHLQDEDTIILFGEYLGVQDFGMGNYSILIRVYPE